MAALPFDATSFLILFARVGAVVMLLPAFSEDAIPGRVRLLLGLGLAMGLYGPLAGKLAPVAAAERALPGVIVAELVVGIAIGSVIRILFNAAAMAGSIVSMQVGLSSAIVADAWIGGQTPLLARFVNVAAATVCLAMGVHHLWIAGIVHSYGVFPVGGLPPAPDFAQLAVETVAHAMALSLSLAAPLLVYGILFNVALGLAARMAPALQVFFISQPLNILLGFALFAMVIGATLNAFAMAMAAFMQRGWNF